MIIPQADFEYDKTTSWNHKEESRLKEKYIKLISNKPTWNGCKVQWVY